MKKLKRKEFIKRAAIGAVASTGFISCVDKKEEIEAPNIISKKKIRWRMVTTWPPNFPVMGEACNYFADYVREMSAGRLDIKVFGAGELVPALEAFEAVRVGAAEMGCGAAYYWSGRSPATQFFATVPFGMNAQQVNAWLYSGGGLELWQELYAKFDLVPFPGGNTGVQMGGWFNREINTIADFKGLKMRMPGLGGKVLEKAGASVVLVPGGELYTSLERGVIDATEWVGPFHDYLMGFYKIAKYYYSPGWHEPGTILEFFANKGKLEKLDKDLQAIVKYAADKINIWILSEFEARNNSYLDKLIHEENVELRNFSPAILSQLKVYTDDVLSEIVEKDAFSKKVYDSYSKFHTQIKKWNQYSERAYHNIG